MTKDDDAKHLHNSKNNPQKTSKELKMNFDKSSDQISSTTVRRRFFAQWKKSQMAKTKQLPTTSMKKKGAAGQKMQRLV